VLGPIAILLIGALGVYGLTQTHDPFDLVLSLLLLLLAAAGGLGTIASLRGKAYVALLRDGILIRSIAGWIFVTWESIEAVGYYTVSWQVNLGLRTTEPPRSGGVQFIPALNRRFRGLIGGWDVGLPLWPIDRSEEMVELVKRCIADPSARATLGRSSAA
jgi:hypothetical protein